jgi:ribosomal protein S6--L-glutamate ligase
MGGQPSMDGGVRVALLVEGRYLMQRQPRGLVEELRRRGCAVTVIDPGLSAISLADDSWLTGIDVCVARGRSDAVLSRLLAAERHGVPTINRAAAVAAVVDKAGMAATLAGAGIPTPPTTLGTPAQLAAALVPDLYPVVLKPVRGDNCRGLRVCGTRADVARIGAAEEPVLAQPYLANDGTDLKLYGAGDRVWAVRKPSPLRREAPSSWPGTLAASVRVELTSSLRQLALDCAALFGLELFGVDCVVTGGGPVVIEVNDFPNYTGVPDADEALADHVLARPPAAAPPDPAVAEVAR